VDATSRKRYLELLNAFGGVKVLVAGDVMLDEYIWGEVERISPEAPVPVVQVREETWVPGGAANVANNISALGGKAYIAGLIGADHAGRRLSTLLRRLGIKTDGLIADPERPTITKSRVLAGHQQAIRIDREETKPVGRKSLSGIRDRFKSLVSSVDVVVIEDYAKGLFSQDLVDDLIQIAAREKRPVLVDPSSGNLFTFRGAGIVTPNLKEALAASGLPRGTPVAKVGRSLLRRWGSGAVLVTLGEDGMALFEPGKRYYHIPTVAREVFDVSGAGDTVVGTLAMALAAGGSLSEAAFLANCAAGVVVGKLGTATAGIEEILEALDWR